MARTCACSPLCACYVWSQACTMHACICKPMLSMRAGRFLQVLGATQPACQRLIAGASRSCTTTHKAAQQWMLCCPLNTSARSPSTQTCTTPTPLMSSSHIAQRAACRVAKLAASRGFCQRNQGMSKPLAWQSIGAAPTGITAPWHLPANSSLAQTTHVTQCIHKQRTLIALSTATAARAVSFQPPAAAALRPMRASRSHALRASALSST
jgi:hypothetical protein